MLELSLVGIGAGNPQHLTLEAIEALRRADVILIPQKGAQKDDLAQLRQEICAAHLQDQSVKIKTFDLPKRDPNIADYEHRVEAWHTEISNVWLREIEATCGCNGNVAFLVWGDPSLYDSTIRIADRLRSRMDLSIKVIPGITALQSLTAGFAIPLNEVGAAVTITTGRKLRENGWPASADTIAVMLDQGGAFECLDPKGIYIYWAAFAGMPNELRIEGPLAEVGPQILKARSEAREAHGWIMDIYLMRRSSA